MTFKLTSARIFIGGVLCGSLVSVFAAKTFYEAEFQKKVDSLMDDVKDDESDISQVEEKNDTIKETAKAKTVSTTMTEEERQRYADALKKTNYQKAFVKEEKEVVQEGAAPSEEAIYTISMQEFVDQVAGYEQQSITYYADGYVTDEFGDTLDIYDIANPLIKKTLDELKENEAIYVRNERDQMEYDILKTYKSFEDGDDDD